MHHCSNPTAKLLTPRRTKSCSPTGRRIFVSPEGVADLDSRGAGVPPSVPRRFAHLPDLFSDYFITVEMLSKCFRCVQ